MTQLQDLIQAVEYLRTRTVTTLVNVHSEKMDDMVWSSDSYWFQEDEGLSEQVAEEMVVSQADALKVSGGVDLLEQLRELRLQNVHLKSHNRTATVTLLAQVTSGSRCVKLCIHRQICISTLLMTSLMLSVHLYAFIF